MSVLLIAGNLLGFATPALAHFVDEFDRPDGAQIGNGWIEKNPGAFALSSGTAVKQVVGTGYRDNIVYRPAAENVLDVEATAQLRFSSTATGYAQVMVRVQTDTVGDADVLDGYILYVNNSTTNVILGRQTGTGFVTSLSSTTLTVPFNTTDEFRLRLRAQGTNPVVLEGYVERRGTDGIWETIGQAFAWDYDLDRITTAGTVGFGGYTEASYAFTSFTRVDLGAVGTPNPSPVTVGLSPSQADAGESGLVVVVYGSGFTTDSVARWNGAARPTTYVSPSELEVSLSEADIASAGDGSITVFNPAPGGGTSNAQTFTVTAPQLGPPAITELSPPSSSVGSGPITLVVTGTQFDASSVVRWNGSNRATTYVSSTRLEATIPATDLQSPGTAAVTVFRASDGASTAAVSFAIAPLATGDFTDTFDRADSATIGNGWIEKTPAAFSIAGGEVAKLGAGPGYRDNLVYRPAGENLVDVEAAVELRFLTLPTGYPQIFVRGQSGTIAAADQFDAYLLYVNNSTSEVILGRQRGTNFVTTLATINLSSGFNTTDRFRLRLRAQGTNPVQLAAYVERLNGGTWQAIGSAAFSDATADRITGAGTVGFSGYVETNYRYENFTRTSLGPASNPVPVATALAPSTAIAGSGAFTLTVTGSNFVDGSVVRWNGADRATTFVSPTELTATILATDVATAGTASVTVFNPAPGGGLSGGLTFTIGTPADNPVPSISSLSPASATVGTGAFTLTVTGNDFVEGSVVRWNGVARATTFISPTQITAAILASDVATAGTASVTVFNPAPGGGTSAPVNFTISSTNPVPTLSGLAPSSTPAGGPPFTLTVSGSNFVPGSVVRWNGSNRPTTYVSPNQLTASISASDIASTGSRSVTVFNPGPGGGTSAALTFTITPATGINPLPVLTATSPTSWPTGGGSFQLSVFGSGFTSQSVVHWNGSPRPTTLVSANQLIATIGAADTANAAVATVTVFTPAPGGGRSAPLPFFVQDASVQYFIDGFNRADGETIGNGWIEKDPVAFSLANSEVTSIPTASGFMQNIMYRPASEARQDVEVSVEFRRLPSAPPIETLNFPQVHARVQTDTVAVAYTLDSYIFFIDESASNPARAMFAIMGAPGPGPRYECYIAPVPLPAPLVVGERYRLRFRVTGTAPVVLWGAVDHYSNGSWTNLATGTTTHDVDTPRDPSLVCDGEDLPPPITSAGTVGIAKFLNRTDVYDNFYVRDAFVDPPTITSLSPAGATAGAGGFTLTINGSGFQPNSIVQWNGAARPTTYVSSTQVRATISAADIALSGLATVKVVNNPNGDSQESAEAVLSIAPATGTVAFVDTFNRRSSTNLGNGWIEKTPDAFMLRDGRVDKVPTFGGDSRNNLVFRPAGEDRRDVEALLEFKVKSLPVGYPALLVRVQQSTAQLSGAFEGYMLYVRNGSPEAVIARQNLTGYDQPLAFFDLSEPLAVGGNYRLRLSAVGATNVALQASVERLSNGVWSVIGQASATDNSSSRIATAGAVGFTGYTEDSYSFDNFRRVNLGAN